MFGAAGAACGNCRYHLSLVSRDSHPVTCAPSAEVSLGRRARLYQAQPYFSTVVGFRAHAVHRARCRPRGLVRPRTPLHCLSNRRAEVICTLAVSVLSSLLCLPPRSVSISIILLGHCGPCFPTPGSCAFPTGGLPFGFVSDAYFDSSCSTLANCSAMVPASRPLHDRKATNHYFSPFSLSTATCWQSRKCRHKGGAVRSHRRS